MAVTQVAEANSKDLEKRQRQYLISMAIRVVCFIMLVVTPSPWRWFFLIGAAVIPWFAVVIANVSEPRVVTPDQPEESAGPLQLSAGEVIEGEVVPDPEPTTKPRAPG